MFKWRDFHPDGVGMALFMSTSSRGTEKAAALWMGNLYRAIHTHETRPVIYNANQKTG